MTVDGLGQPISTDSEAKAPAEKTEPKVEEEPKEPEPVKETAAEPVKESVSETTTEPIKEPTTDSATSSKPTEESTESKPPTEETAPIEETKTLATNTAGESILEETVDKKPEGDQVHAVEGAKDEVVS